MEVTKQELDRMFQGLEKRISDIGKVKEITRPVVFTLPLTTANTEYKYVIPDGTVAFEIHTQDGTAWRFAFETGKIGSAAPSKPYYTVAANDALKERGLNTKNLTIYVACGSSSKVLEGICWKKEEYKE